MSAPDLDENSGCESSPAASGDYPTIKTEQASPLGRQWIRSGFDLLIESVASGLSARVPICYNHLTIGSPNGPKDNDISLDDSSISNRQALLKLIDSKVFFNNLDPSLEILINNAPSTFCELKPGDKILIGNHLISLINLSNTVAFLEGYTQPHRRQHWTINQSQTHIGRTGKRTNQIELQDLTVSREHATIHLSKDQFIIKRDSSHQIWVNNEPIKSLKVLCDEDLIQLGQQLLRFRSYNAKNSPRELLPSQATILFSDIWDYTSLTESRPLEESMAQLNEVYKRLGKVIVDYGGVLMTYLGDAMMAVFEHKKDSDSDSSKPAVLAVHSGLAMLQALNELNQSWEKKGTPQLIIGIGIATGEVMVGDVGATGHREFAAIGDTTNIASRIEKLTRQYGTQLLVNAETARQVSHAFELKELGVVEVKGRRKPVNIFEVLAVNR